MKIQSKKSKAVHDVSKGQWAAMVERGEKRKYTIVDERDDSTETVVVREIMDFSKQPEREYPANDAIRAFLDKNDIKFHSGLGTKKLRILYTETKQKQANE